MADSRKKLWGLLAEFDSVDDIMHAAEAVREAGYEKWDCHTPFPVHGLNGAMGLEETKLPLFVFGAGVTGAVAGLAMQYWMNAVDYPIVISGKPLFSLPANIPIIFELTILFSALTAFAGMIALNRLPRHNHPLFSSDRFRRVTDDRFFVVIEAGDPKFDEEEATRLLESLGGLGIERVEEED